MIWARHDLFAQIDFLQKGCKYPSSLLIQSCRVKFDTLDPHLVTLLKVHCQYFLYIGIGTLGQA